MLAIENLQIRANPFDGPALIEGLSIKVERYQAVGIVGPSGCGKSTLLRSIAGLIDPVGGEVAIDGRSPMELGYPEFRRRVMLVPQRPTVWDGSVCDNLLRPRSFDAVRHEYTRGGCEAMLGKVGLADKLDASAATLSEGEKQRVCLVRAVLAEPDFLLLDEPTSALDGGSVGWVESLLRQAMSDNDGMGALVATHDRAFAERFCSNVIDLADYMPAGKVVSHA